MNGFYKFVRVLAKIICCIFRIKTDGAENFCKDKNVIICCNHQSFWDMPILIAKCPYQIHFMAKKELFKNKLFSKVLYSLGVFPVSRGAGDVSAIKTAISVTQNGVLGIFPEGTRRPLCRPDKPKAGAALVAIESRSDILPVAINYNGRIGVFARINLNIGKIIPVQNYLPADLSSKISRSALKELSNDITNSITELWDKK